MNTYEAKKLLLQSLRCLAMSMEQIRQRETEKVMGDDEPMQDHLALDGRARINYPSTLGNNWVWRMKEGAATKEIADRLYNLSKTNSRLEEK